MCGIYGSTIQYNEEQVKNKLKRTNFRGPDQMGWKFFESRNASIVFGHNRLSIIDLDPRSNQPFSYLDKIYIAFNGEIFNFKDIKKTLLAKGYSFNTTSDTEVMCAAYLEYGEDCVNHFNGMFAFVIYDEHKQQFFGARDRLGQKPFYYYHNGKDFEFASQLSSIKLHNDKLSISEKAIADYLVWGAIPDPQSIFNEINKLKAGMSFIYDLESGKLDIKRYWDIDSQGKSKFTGTYKEAQDELNTILSDAVSIRLFADVPVGVFLSGGVDSSLVTALATKSSEAQTKTFSVKFNEKGFDESIYAKKVADHLKTDHHIIECNYDEGMDLIQNFSHYYDEPFADSSAIPSMLLAKYTKQHVTVALSGDGGDESFIGYHRYDWINTGRKVHTIPHPLRKFAAGILHLSPNYKHKIISKAISYKTINDVYLASMSSMDLSYLNKEIDLKDIEELSYLFHDKKGLQERVSDFDIKTYLNWHINTKVDRATMAYSLEARSPLMDYRVVEFGRSLPTEFKTYKGNQKRILKDILYQSVPKEIFDRPKAGFTMPFQRWFREDLKDYVLSELDDASLRSIPCINVDEIKSQINEHMDGTWNRYTLIWKLLVLKQWLKTDGQSYSIK
jgi:asparagine synthase (glutamine-hydrolysing)